MLEQVLRHLNNWFVVDVHDGSFVVDGGGITLPFLQDGQYFRVVGSVFNDGVYQYPFLPFHWFFGFPQNRSLYSSFWSPSLSDTSPILPIRLVTT